jgi:hypothetical protein
VSLKISRIATFAAALATVGAMSGATAPASTAALRITPTFKNWVVSGSLTAKTFNQKVTLPEGSTFNGAGEVFVEDPSGTPLAWGTIMGTVFVPPFNATLTLPINEIPTPVSVGITFSQVGTAEGTLESAPPAGCATAGACVTVSVPTKANVAFTVVGILGLKVPTHCETREPIALPLGATLSLLEIVTKGTQFTGTATIPPIKCQGLKGILLAPILTAALSGPGNPYSITLSPPPPTEEA